MGIRTHRRRRRQQHSEDATADQQAKKMKTAEPATAPHRVSLPNELIMEVLLRLPARSIARFRCACRSWNAETSSPAFLDRHRALAAAKLAFVPLAPAHTYHALTTMRVSPMRLKCLRCPRLIGAKSCRGFVLVRRYCADAGAFCVWNPTTGEVLHLPPSQEKLGPPGSCLVTGLGFDAAAGEYKVVEVSIELDNLHARVLTLGDAGGWRRAPAAAGDQAAAAALGFTEHAIIEHHLDPVFADGCLHWSFRTHYLYADQPHGVLSFSLAGESFRRVPQPPFVTADLVPYNRDYKPLLPHEHLLRGRGRMSGSVRAVVPPVGTMLAELDGRLCVVRDVRRRSDVPGQLEVWKLQSYETGTWSLDYRVDLTGRRVTKQQLTRPWLVVPLRYIDGDGDGPGEKRKLLLATSAQAAHVYDPEANTLKTVASLAGRRRQDVGGNNSSSAPEGDEFPRIMMYQESLVRIAGMEQGKGEIKVVRLD